jgi:fatty acid desaturase
LHALHVFLFHIIGYYILWNHGDNLFAVLIAVLCHTISQAQSAWAQHDYGHSSLLAKPKYNRYIQMIFLGVIKGASADWWNYMHNQHHAKPNVLNIDPDVRLSPYFVLGETDPKRKAIKNAKKEENFLYPYSQQHYYFPFGYYYFFI